MKKAIIALLTLGSFSLTAQIKTPAPSPSAKIVQTVGVTEVTIDYSRPHKRDRKIFGELVEFDKMWRTGANKNTTITVSDVLIFGNDTLPAGTYSIFTTPKSGTSWDVYFYKDANNWGTPENWDEKLVAIKTTATARKTTTVTESFTISLENVTSNGAELSFAWDKTKAVTPFNVATKSAVIKSIENVMAGPSSGDYYRTASYYLSEKMEMKKALEYINKALEMRENKPFWYLRQKALIQAELGDYKGATATARLSMKAAEEAENDDYVKSNKKSIEEWTKK
ncbi:MAG: DUF2911 domain-containing protein [Crocinitomicaceae bacterium]|nr:DUF2911 domain-containing protein [Crocinitomicaceae bacterium]